MNKIMNAVCGSLLMAASATAVPASAQMFPHGWGGFGHGVHGPIMGGHGGHGFGGFHGGFNHGFHHGGFRGNFDQWRRRERGDACDILGYGHRYGCLSIADVPYLILSLNDEVYCYSRDYDRPVAIECPYDWYDY